MPRELVLLGVVVACASSGTTSAWEHPPQRVHYKPGQSIAEARICTCRECVDRACCSGDPETESGGEVELGMTLAVCGSCARRVWTARGAESCDALAGPTCCPGTVSD